VASVAATVALLLVAPVVGTSAAVLVLTLARAAWHTRVGLAERRLARGRRASDGVVAAASTPWYLALGAPAAVVQVGIAGLVGLLSALGVQAVLGLGPRPTAVVGAVVAALLVWRGPWSRRSRLGAAILAAPLIRHPRLAWAGVVLLLVAAWAGVAWWESAGASWWPLPERPW
jgi:hypothetical protein